MVVKTCESAPAEVECGIDMRLAPFHDLAEFGPVVDFLERKLFDRCAGNDHAVEILF